MTEVVNPVEVVLDALNKKTRPQIPGKVGSSSLPLFLMKIPSTHPVTWDGKHVKPGYYIIDYFNTMKSAENLIGRHHLPVEYAYLIEDEHCRLWQWPEDPINPNGGRSLMVMTAGGIGDTIFILPCIEEIKRRWPDCRVAVSVNSIVAPVARMCSAVDEVVDFPLRLDDQKRYVNVVGSVGAIRDNPDGKILHAIDAMRKWMLMPTYVEYLEECDREGIEAKSWIEYQSCQIVVPDDLKWKHRYTLKRERVDQPIIVIQGFATNTLRNYPLDKMADLVAALCIGGAKVIIVGASGQWGWWQRTTRDRKGRKMVTKIQPPPGLINLCERNRTPLDDTVAIIDGCDLVLSPDSGAVHIAGTLRKPVLALFGPFPPDLRTTQYPSCVNLCGKMDCAPCQEEVCKRNPGSVECEAMHTISPEVILATVEELLELTKPGMGRGRFLHYYEEGKRAA
jgi:ADP-heptose:LPS heptosyltransferase